MVKEAWMPYTYFCICGEPEDESTDGLAVYKLYFYNKNNPLDPVTGKFRPFASFYSDLYGKPKINDVVVEGSEDGGYYHLQNKLYAIHELEDGSREIDRNDSESAGPGILIDNQT